MIESIFGKITIPLKPVQLANDIPVSFREKKLLRGIVEITLLLIYFLLAIVVGIYIWLSLDKRLKKYLYEDEKVVVPAQIQELHEEYGKLKELVGDSSYARVGTKIDSLWEKAANMPIEDKLGRRAILNIYTLSSKYHWEKGSTKIAKLDAFMAGESFAKYLKTDGFYSRYAQYAEIVCIGNASYEESSKSVEECRAYCRASRLKHLLEHEAIPNKIHILNLGISDSTRLHSDLQRAVVVIGVTKVDSLIDLKNAMYSHLLKDRTLPFRFWDYSLCKDYPSFFNSKIPCEGLNYHEICDVKTRHASLKNNHQMMKTSFL